MLRSIRILIFLPLIFAAVGWPQSSPGESSVLELIRADLVARVNRERAGAGLVSLARHPALDRAAQAGVRLALEQTAGQSGRDGRLPEATITTGDLTGWLREEGYEPRRATVHAVVTEAAAETALDDLLFGPPGPQAPRGLLDPGLRELGVGVGGWGSLQVVVLVPALSMAGDFAIRTAGLGDLNRVRAELLALSNEARAARGRSPLSSDACLERVAQAYAERMLEESFYGHVSPDRRDAMYRARAGNCFNRRIAENLAHGQESAAEVIDGWMESAGHRQNLLDRRSSRVGFGVSVGRNQQGFRILWVQMLGSA